MKFKLLTLLVSTLLFSSNTFAKDNDEACKAVLCLSGGLVGESGFSECAAPIETYALIRIYVSGKFIPHATAFARHKYLEQCESADPMIMSQITTSFGDKEYLNVNL